MFTIPLHSHILARFSITASWLHAKRLCASVIIKAMLSAITKRMSVGQHSFYSNKLLRYILGIIFILACAHLILQYLNLEVYNEKNGAIFELSNRFDFDDEASVNTWFSQFLFILLGVIAFFAAYMEKERVLKVIWFIPGVIATLFSIDETATVHEFLLEQIHVALYKDDAPTVLSNSWVIVLPFILIIGGLFLWQILKHLPKKTVVLIAAGGVIFLSGAVLVDIVTSTIPESPFVAQGIFVALEELGELLGVTAVIYAVSSYVENKHATAVHRAIKALKS